MPCPEAQAGFEQLSQQARCTLAGSMLPPHITLYSDRLDSRTDAINRLKQVAKVCQPTYLRSVAIEAGPLFTKSLVVRFCNSDQLTHLATA